MRGPELLPATARGADHEGHACLAAEHAVDLRGVVDDLIEREQREVDRHDLHHRAEAEHCRADRGAGEPLLGDGGVPHPLLPELLEQAARDLVGALKDADLLAEQEHAVVAEHLGPQGVVQGLTVGHDGHADAPIGENGAGSNRGWPGRRRESFGTSVA